MALIDKGQRNLTISRRWNHGFGFDNGQAIDYGYGKHRQEIDKMKRKCEWLCD